MRTIRTRRNLTQEQASELSGFGRSAISEWEIGEHLPALEKLQRYLNSLDATEIERSELAFFLDTPEAIYQFGIRPRFRTHSVLGEALRGYRLQRGLSQRELADNLEVSPSTVSNWESGAKLPNSHSEYKLGPLLNLTMQSGGVESVRSLWKVRTPEDLRLLLPKVANANESDDLLKTLVLFHAARFKWLTHPRWLEVMLICGCCYADLLMSANRNRELFSFTDSLLSEIDRSTPLSDRLEMLHIMRAVALLRLNQGNCKLSLKQVARFDTLSRGFKTHYVWGRLTVGGLYATIGKLSTIRESVINDPCFTINRREFAAGAQFHLYANLLCDAGKPLRAEKLIETGWDAYWKWADPKAPYMSMMDVTAAKTYRLLGDYGASEKHLNDASHKLDLLDNKWRPGSISHVRTRVESERQLLDVFNFFRHQVHEA